MRERIKLADTVAFQIVIHGRWLITQNRPKEAMSVFETGFKRYPTTSNTLVGMARGYSANGDNMKTLMFINDALKYENNPQSKGSIEGPIKKLENGESIN